MASLTPRLDRLEINKIINGRLDFWQRGTTKAISGSSNQYLADRFSSANNLTGSGTFTASRQTDAPNSESVYALQLAVGTAGSAADTGHFLMTHQYIIEGYDYLPIHGKIVTLSFWVKASVTGTYGLTLMNSANTRAYATTYSVTAANTWQKKSVTVTLDSTGTWLFDNSAGLKIQWLASAGSTKQITPNTWTTVSTGNVIASTASNSLLTTAGATISVAQVCLIVGDTAPDYFLTAGRTAQEELAFCQRYYEKSYDIEVTPGTTNTTLGAEYFVQIRTDTNWLSHRFSQRKRGVAVVTSYSPINGSSGGAYNDTANSEASTSLANMSQTGFSNVTNYGSQQRIRFQWVADAEF